MNFPLRALIVGDCEADVQRLEGVLQTAGYEPRLSRVEWGPHLGAALASERWDIIFLENSAGNLNAGRIARLLKKRRLRIPFVVLGPQSPVEESERPARDFGAPPDRPGGGWPQLGNLVRRKLQTVARNRRVRDLQRRLKIRERDLRIAEQIQRRLYPAAMPHIPGYEITARFSSAEAVCGDYFDFLSLSDGAVCIAIGDVSGHGVGPALLMAETRAYLRALAVSHSQVDAMLSAVNRLICQDMDEGRFITLMLARLEWPSRTLTYASAGHRGYLLDRSGNWKSDLTSTGFPLGLAAEVDYPKPTTVPLDPGDIILLTTDGVEETSSRDGTLFGRQRVVDAIRADPDRTATELVRNLLQTAAAFAGNQRQRDDMTAIVIKVAADAQA